MPWQLLGAVAEWIVSTSCSRVSEVELAREKWKIIVGWGIS